LSDRGGLYGIDHLSSSRRSRQHSDRVYVKFERIVWVGGWKYQYDECVADVHDEWAGAGKYADDRWERAEREHE